MHMKKVYLAILALAGLFAASCEQEHIDAQFFQDNVTGQTLGNIPGMELSEAGPAITASYTEVDFGLSVPTSYTLWMDLSGSNFANAKKVDASFSDGTLSFAQKKFNKNLLNMGVAPGTEVAVDFRLDAYMQNEKLANIEEYVQHSNVVTATFTVYEEVKGDIPVVDVPGDYQGWAPSEYPKLFNYKYDEITYRGVVDFQCVKEDGTAANGFKITGGGNWDNDSGNWGSEAQGEAPEAGTVKLVNGDGSQNIICYGAKRYYLFSFNKEELTLNNIMSFDKVGVIGLNGDWDNDVVMTYNMYYGRFWADIDVASATDFKFRLDGAWDNNWGGDLESLQGGGDNIPVEAGQYRVYFYMNDETVYAELDASMYGQEEPTIEKPDDPVPAYQGWGIIGVGGDWENDIAMTEKDGVWTGYANLAAEDSWKLRKDAAWDENFGGVFASLDTPFEAVAGGDNIAVGAAGFFKIVLNTNDNTITVSDGNVWGVIGDFNDWAGDSFMTLTDGKWVSDVLEITGGWKIRKNSGWDENFGGTFEAFDTPFEAVADGDNINCGDGKFVITYDPEAGTITVSNAAKSWGVIGDFNGWAGDVAMSEVMPGIWVSNEAITNGEGQGFKVRFDSDWAVNRGGSPSAQGEFVRAVPDGANIGLAGTFKVVYNANNETIGTLGWGVTGSIASCGISWDYDVPMNLAADGKWYSMPFALGEGEEIKIRWSAGWDQDFGGVCAEAETEFEAVAGGSNIKAPAAGTWMVVYDPENGTMSLTKSFWGLIGDFNGWGGDTFMLPLGDGRWAAYGQTMAGGWKCRMSSDWAVNFGGAFGTLGEAFTVYQNGDNINCDLEDIDIVLDTAAETITIDRLG